MFKAFWTPDISQKYSLSDRRNSENSVWNWPYFSLFFKYSLTQNLFVFRLGGFCFFRMENLALTSARTQMYWERRNISLCASMLLECCYICVQVSTFGALFQVPQNSWSGNSGTDLWRLSDISAKSGPVGKQWNPRLSGIFPTYENQALGRYSFLLGSEECVLVILQNYVVYFNFFCSVREKNLSEKEVAWTFVALSLITFLMSDIGLNCHYFGYELALKCFFEIKLWRYREIWGLPSEKKEHFRAWLYKMCTHQPGLNSGDEIAWSSKWSQIHKPQPPTRLDILNSTELKFDLRVYVYVAFFFLFLRL